jgi:hypothetical protein
MARRQRDFYTLAEAAGVLEVSQRHLLEKLRTGEIEGEQDPQSSRWKIPKYSIQEHVPEPVPADPSPEATIEEFSGQPAETVEELVAELDTLQRELGRLRNRLDLARRTEKDERQLLLAELEQEREGRRRDREEAESTLQVERDRLLDDQRRQREHADKLQAEVNRLRQELESERNKGSWRGLFGR